MDDILFKGKDILSEKWLYGLIAGRVMQRDGREMINLHHKTGVQPVWMDTVGQYVGREDSEGKCIFKDDIVIADNLGGGDEQQLVVYSYDGVFAIDYKTGDGDYQAVAWFDGTLNIIGNIHDNPELLK